MTTDTLTLTAFLLARIEEDEERAASDIDHFCDPNDNADKWITMYAKRLAAECAAKRMIVELAASWEAQAGRAIGHDVDAVMLRTQAITSQTILRQLAAMYASHDDYRADWA